MFRPRLIPTALCIVVILPLSVAAGYASANAYVGYYAPVIQPDAQAGVVTGVSSRIKIVATLYIEPYFFQIRETDRDVTNGGARIHRGTTITSIGGNAIVGTWLTELARPYALVGIGLVRVRPGGGGNISNRFCSNWGAGVEYSLLPTRLFLDLSARLLLIHWEGSIGMKSILIIGGLSWYFKLNR